MMNRTLSRDLRSALQMGCAMMGAMLLAAAAAAASSSPPPAPAQGRRIDSAANYAVLPSHERVAPENRILTDRLEHLLPALMAETGLDMWVVVNREYAEDPVYFTLVPQPSFAARRTTMLVFSRAADGSVERLAVNRYPLGEPYKSAWSGGDLDAQWKALGALIAGRDPKRIGIDASRTWPAADGLTHALHERLVEVLPAEYAKRLVSAEALIVRWIETRTPAEQALYPHIDSITRGVISEAFSGRVITAGVTTTDEVAWYIRERYESLGLRLSSCRRWIVSGPASRVRRELWRALRRGGTDRGGRCPAYRRGVLLPEALHRHPGDGLRAQGRRGGRSGGPQDRVGEQQPLAGHPDRRLPGGRTGNEILAATIKGCASAGLACSTYSHPLGFFGHSLGPTIGMWDNQGADARNGRLPVTPGHRVCNRGQHCNAAAGVGRATPADHARAGCAIRWQGRALPGGTPDGMASDPIGLSRPLRGSRSAPL